MPSLGVHFDKAELASLQAKLRDGGLKLYQKPMQKFMREGAVVMYQEAIKRAPASLAATISVGPITPKPWGIGRVVIRSGTGGSGKNRNRSAVAAVLNNRIMYTAAGAGKTKRARFKRGKVERAGTQTALKNPPARWRVGPRAGKATEKWFHGTLRLTATKRRIAGLLRDAAVDIERIWSAR